MGNPFIRSEAFQPTTAAQPEAANGILARVPGQFIAQGSKQLPVAGKGQPQRLDATVDTPDLGTVRITYRLNSYTHGRFRHWHWVAERAERAA